MPRCAGSACSMRRLRSSAQSRAHLARPLHKMRPTRDRAPLAAHVTSPDGLDAPDARSVEQSIAECTMRTQVKKGECIESAALGRLGGPICRLTSTLRPAQGNLACWAAYMCQSDHVLRTLRTSESGHREGRRGGGRGHRCASGGGHTSSCGSCQTRWEG